MSSCTLTLVRRAQGHRDMWGTRDKVVQQTSLLPLPPAPSR